MSQYEHAIRACFNLPVHAELQGKDLTQRQAWLAKEARGRLRIDETTCRRDLRDALDQIEQQILAPGYQPVQIGEAVDDPQKVTEDFPPVLETEFVPTPEPAQTSAAADEPPAIANGLPTEPDLSEAAALGVQVLPEPQAVDPPEPASPRVIYLWPPRFTRRSAAIATLIAVICAGLGVLGVEIATGNLLPPPKPAPKQLQAPETISQVSVCHDGGNSWAALRTPAGVVLNFGVLNASAGESKWELQTDADYNQVVDAQLFYQNQSKIKQTLGVTIQLVQPFAHKGNVWTITWRVTAGGSTTNISAPINLGRPDAKLVYIPNSTTIKAPDPAGKYKVTHASDSELLAPSEPLQTLNPDDVSSILAQFRAEIPSLSIDVEAKSSQVNDWLRTIYAQPGDTLSIAVIVGNDGNTVLYGAAVNFLIPQGAAYIPGSSTISPSMSAPGKAVGNNIIVSNLSQRGINIGTLQPGQQVVVQLKARIGNHVRSGAALYGFSEVTAADIDYHWNELKIYVQ
jgi:uncharacterized repeat protein (TIGR01451 family)